MKKLFFFGVALLLLVSCNTTPTSAPKTYPYTGESNSSKSSGSSSAYGSSSSSDDVYEIEDALQRLWNDTNRNGATGVISCNVFNVKVTSSYGSEYKVSYSLRSTYSNGQKTVVKFEGAKVVKEDGIFVAKSEGYF